MSTSIQSRGLVNTSLKWSYKEFELTRTTREDPSGAHASETFSPYLLNELVDRSTSASRVVGCEQTNLNQLKDSRRRCLSTSLTDPDAPQLERLGLQDEGQGRPFIRDERDRRVVRRPRRSQDLGRSRGKVHSRCQILNVSSLSRVVSVRHMRELGSRY